MANNSKALVLLLTTLLSVGLALTLPDPHRYLPHSFLNVDTTHMEEWRLALDDAAHDAVKVINSYRPLDQHLALDAVQVDGVKLGRALAFSGTIEISHIDDRLPSSYAFTQHSDFVHLQPVGPLTPLWTLPSATAVLPAIPQPDDVPVFPDVELAGPLVLYLDHQLYDPVMRLPHQVDAGAVRIIKVGPGVRLSMSGISQMKLRSSLDVQRNLKLLALIDENATSAKGASSAGGHPEMDVPELDLQLTDKGQAFRVWSPAAERVKVKRRSANVVELLPPSTSSDVSSPLATVQTEGATDLATHTEPSSPRWVLSQANLLRAVVSAFAHAAENQPAVVRRVVEAKAEAVNVLVIPMTLKAEQPHNTHGGSWEWQAVVTRGPGGRHTVVSHQELLPPENNVSIAPSVWANNTWPAVMHHVQLIQQHGHQAPQASS